MGHNFQLSLSLLLSGCSGGFIYGRMAWAEPDNHQRGLCPGLIGERGFFFSFKGLMMKAFS